MKTVYGLAAVLAVSFSALAMSTTSGSAAVSQKHPGGRYCLGYYHGGSDCGFATLMECKSSAAGTAGECFRNVFHRDDSAI
jgi:hypothetical protein